MVAWVVIFSFDPRPAAPYRHVTKIPSPQLLLFPTLTNRDARNPFRFRSYANTGVSPAFSSRCSQPFVALYFPKSFKCNTYGPPACVANKRLTPKVNPLDATLTKNRGRGVHPLAPCLLFGATIRKLGHPTSLFAGGTRMHRRILPLFALVLALSAPAFAQEHSEHTAPAKTKSAMLMTGLGNWHHPVSTKNAQAQGLLRSGPAAHLRLQSRRSHALLPARC